MTTPDFDQHLVDYTVRNITTGDEEDIRVLELDPDEVAGFPAAVREQVAALIADGQHSNARWTVNQERILQLLLPFITNRELYEHDYQLWEALVLDPEQPATDIYPPEDVAFKVRGVLDQAVSAAIENWNEGHWDDWTVSTTERTALEALIGFLQSLTEMSDEDYESHRTLVLREP